MIYQNTIFTIGHSNYDSDTFIKLLTDHAINAVADVRQFPYSSYVPQFNRDNIAMTLQKNDIKYVFLGDHLGARPNDLKCYTNNQVDFYKLSKAPFFKEGIKRLLEGTRALRVALMCAEKDPLTCHRTILVCKNLKEENVKILHIMQDSSLEEHSATEIRLLHAHKLQVNELFRSPEEILEDAYKRQGQKMAATFNDDQQFP